MAGGVLVHLEAEGLKLVMDASFGLANFRNEAVWNGRNSGISSV